MIFFLKWCILYLIVPCQKKKIYIYIYIYTSSCRIWFCLETTSYSFLSELYDSSRCFTLHRARRFWNQTATWRGCRRSSFDSFTFLSESSLISSWKLCSSEANCSVVSFCFFFIISSSLLGYWHALVIFSDDSGTEITGPVCVRTGVDEFPGKT